MDVIEKIEQLRQARKWTKYRLAEEAMINYSTLSAIYTRDTPPKIDILEMICKAFGITLAEFFMENNNENIITEKEKELLHWYRELPEEKKKAILTIIDK